MRFIIVYSLFISLQGRMSSASFSSVKIGVIACITIGSESGLRRGSFSTSTGQRSDQYWSRHEPLLVDMSNQYWSER